MREAPGPVELAPISNVAVTVKLTDKTSTVYRTIGQLAGVNVLFDPDSSAVTEKVIKVELNGVTLEEALEITALESKTFWRPVTRTRFSSRKITLRNARNSNKAYSKLFIFRIFRSLPSCRM